MNSRTIFRGASVAPLLCLLVPLAGCGSSTNGGEADGGGKTDARAEHDATTDARSDGKVADDGGKTPDAKSDAKGSDAAEDAGPPPEKVTFSIDVNGGPARQFKPPTKPASVSPYIYGVNASGSSGALGKVTQKKTKWGLVRMGGNAFTDWNWTNNYLNLGDTSCFDQEQLTGGSALAGAATGGVDSISAAQGEGAAYLATVPVLEHVSAAVANDTSSACPAKASDCAGGTTSSTNVNTGKLLFASVDGGSPAFVGNAAQKSGAFCTCPPGATCDAGAAGCTVSTQPVYQDEFVNFLSTTYASTASTIFFDLDNEPNYWGFTHPELWPYTGTLPCETTTDVTYDDIVNRDIAFASAIKGASPSAKVFGPVVAQDGLIYAHAYPDKHWPTEFLDYYLQQMAAATSEAGGPLLDALDVHYYNLTGSGPTQCVQNPRMFWDPNYTELSASDTDAIDFTYAGTDNYFDTNWYPRELVPRLLRKIATAYGSSSSAPRLSFSEYNSGCESVIAGAVAEADNLGIFGREAVFAASFMTQATKTADDYALAAFDLYRNYDGKGAVVGDTAVHATTSNVAFTSVYGFADSADASKVDVVAINKAPNTIEATLSIANAPALTTATPYQIVDGSASVVAVTGKKPAVTCKGGTCTVTYDMPAMSATTLILR